MSLLHYVLSPYLYSPILISLFLYNPSPPKSPSHPPSHPTPNSLTNRHHPILIQTANIPATSPVRDQARFPIGAAFAVLPVGVFAWWRAGFAVGAAGARGSVGGEACACGEGKCVAVEKVGRVGWGGGEAWGWVSEVDGDFGGVGAGGKGRIFDLPVECSTSSSEPLASRYSLVFHCPSWFVGNSLRLMLAPTTEGSRRVRLLTRAARVAFRMF